MIVDIILYYHVYFLKCHICCCSIAIIYLYHLIYIVFHFVDFLIRCIARLFIDQFIFIYLKFVHDDLMRCILRITLHVNIDVQIYQFKCVALIKIKPKIKCTDLILTFDIGWFIIVAPFESSSFISFFSASFVLDKLHWENIFGNAKLWVPVYLAFNPYINSGYHHMTHQLTSWFVWN